MEKECRHLRDIPAFREELIQLAVTFLTRPSVSDSPIIHRRSSLHNKGLADHEIEEVFLRAPNPSIKADHLLNQGCFSASGVGTFVFLKKFILPRFKIWVHEADEDDNGERNSKSLQEATEAARVAATAAADMRETILAMLDYKNEEKWCIDALVKCLDVQVAEIKLISNAIWKLEGAREAVLTSRKHTQHVSTNVRPSSAPASMRTSVPDHPKPLKEEINGSHPNHTHTAFTKSSLDS